jgi:hypothetical protein
VATAEGVDSRRALARSNKSRHRGGFCFVGYAVLKRYRDCAAPQSNPRRRGAVSRRTGTGWRAAMSTDANRRQSVVRTRRRHASRSTEAAQESARSSVTLHARQNSECPFRHRSDVHAGLATRDTMTGAHAEGLEQRARRLNRRETCTPGDFSLRRVRRQLALRERPSHLPQRLRQRLQRRGIGHPRAGYDAGWEITKVQPHTTQRRVTPAVSSTPGRADSRITMETNRPRIHLAECHDRFPPRVRCATIRRTYGPPNTAP